MAILRIRFTIILLLGLVASVTRGRAAESTTTAAATEAPPSRLGGRFFRTLPGFEVETVYDVPRDQGSWVCLAVDGKGRLITSDQFGPLYRVTLPEAGRPGVTVTRLGVDLGSAQGLLWAFNSLYVVVNRSANDGGSGLYRLRDTDGDDQFDEVRLLRSFAGDGEHGPHAIVPGPDGQSLYLVAGNATSLPKPEQSLVPRHWAEDMLLPHLGQTDGVYRPDRPGGWICRLDPAGTQFELVAVGLRNPYDLAFNDEGELFTFDADMEWDMGTPWYRPTRVNHVAPGAEFGWRTGSSKWPDYYADSLPAVVDIGESSPTGLTFGYGARFPAKYQRALLMGDWSYGKIYAVLLEPHGASYRGTFERFLSGSPLPITDLVVRPRDGALYFLTGGRGTASSLYRVVYRGTEATGAVSRETDAGAPARQQRRRLESLLGEPSAAAVATVWPFLQDRDRYVRSAARIALEQQPVEQWAEKALAETQPRARLAALMALVRCGAPGLRTRVVTALGELNWDKLDRLERLELVRVCSLVCARLGRPDEAERRLILEQFDRRFPAESYELNRELSQLLTYLEAPGLVKRALTGMETAPSQEEQMHYALCLRTLDLNQWTASERERYFRWFGRAIAAGGGVSYNQYLVSIRSEAVERLEPAVHESLKTILAEKPPEDPYQELKQRTTVRQWAVADLLPRLEAGLPGRDLERGRRVFSTAMCIKCHRFNHVGGMTGPDLTGVGSRFDNRTLLESMLEPSKVVSDQYATVEVNTRQGASYTGRIGDQNDREVLLKGDLLNPANITRIQWTNIESVVPSTLSLMPTGLLDYFTAEEIYDLVGYLKAAGDTAPQAAN